MRGPDKCFLRKERNGKGGYAVSALIFSLNAFNHFKSTFFRVFTAQLLLFNKYQDMEMK
jgi:hypothetical protein